MLESIKLEKEGNYYSLYINGLQCGCGYYEDMIDVISTLNSPEAARRYMERNQEE